MRNGGSPYTCAIVARPRVIQLAVFLSLAPAAFAHAERLPTKIFTTADGKEHVFCSPLRANFEGGAVEIKHNCGRPQRLEGSEISKVEVENF